jgi:hypothetical protein
MPLAVWLIDRMTVLSAEDSFMVSVMVNTLHLRQVSLLVHIFELKKGFLWKILSFKTIWKILTLKTNGKRGW